MAFLKDAFWQIDGFIFPRRFHSRFLRMLTDDLNGALVGAEPEENGMAHLGLTRPLGKFYLPHELGNEPRGRLLVRNFFIERLLVSA